MKFDLLTLSLLVVSTKHEPVQSLQICENPKKSLILKSIFVCIAKKWEEILIDNRTSFYFLRPPPPPPPGASPLIMILAEIHRNCLKVKTLSLSLSYKTFLVDIVVIYDVILTLEKPASIAIVMYKNKIELLSKQKKS